MAVAYGLPPDEGLKAVTLYPAQILGVAEQLGTMETGKRANLVLADGDILQASAQVKAVFIDGQPLEPVSKHTQLYERYRERLREVKEGRAPPGTRWRWQSCRWLGASVVAPVHKEFTRSAPEITNRRTAR